MSKNLSDVETGIESVRSSMSTQKILRDSYSGEIEGLKGTLKDVEDEIEKLGGLINTLTVSINVNPSELESLRLKEKELEARLIEAVGELNAQKDAIVSDINSVQEKIEKAVGERDRDNASITAHIRELNLELNNCKRTEIILNKFKDEYDVSEPGFVVKFEERGRKGQTRQRAAPEPEIRACEHAEAD